MGGSIDYPNIEDGEIALNSGTIDTKEYALIKRFSMKGKPAWHAALGGEIGIHGNGSTKLLGDWTAGCIAMTNEGIEALWNLYKIGTRVII